MPADHLAEAQEVLNHSTLDTECDKEHTCTAHLGLLSVPVWTLEPYTEPPLTHS